MDLGKIVSGPLGHPPQRTETNGAANRAVANLAVSLRGQPGTALAGIDNVVNGYFLIKPGPGNLLG